MGQLEDIIKHRAEIQQNILKSFGVDTTENSLEKGLDDEINPFEMEAYKSEISKAELDWFEKAKHQDGDMHPNGKWVWRQSANGGKGDWRVANPGKRGRKSAASASSSSTSSTASKKLSDLSDEEFKNMYEDSKKRFNDLMNNKNVNEESKKKAQTAMEKIEAEKKRRGNNSSSSYFSKLSNSLIEKYSKKKESVSLSDIEEFYEDFLRDRSQEPTRKVYANEAKKTYDAIVSNWRKNDKKESSSNVSKKSQKKQDSNTEVSVEDLIGKQPVSRGPSGLASKQIWETAYHFIDNFLKEPDKKINESNILSQSISILQRKSMWSKKAKFAAENYVVPKIKNAIKKYEQIKQEKQIDEGKAAGYDLSSSDGSKTKTNKISKDPSTIEEALSLVSKTRKKYDKMSDSQLLKEFGIKDMKTIGVGGDDYEKCTVFNKNITLPLMKFCLSLKDANPSLVRIESKQTKKRYRSSEYDDIDYTRYFTEMNVYIEGNLKKLFNKDINFGSSRILFTENSENFAGYNIDFPAGFPLEKFKKIISSFK